MEPAQLLAFNIAILGALASPGPAFLAMARASFTGGRAAGLRTGLGLAAAALTWSALALAGLGALLAVAPVLYTLLKVAGAAYLIWLAITLWRGARDPVADRPAPGLTGFRLGLLTNFANPKAVFFIAAIFSTILPPDAGLALGGQILLNHLALEVLWYSGVALMLTTPPVRAAYIRAKTALDRAAALVLGAMAIRIAT